MKVPIRSARYRHKICSLKSAGFHEVYLHFTLLEVLSVVISMLILAFVCQDGESNWLEGVMMLGVYIILAVAFYNLP